MEKSFLPVGRSFFDHYFWSENRVYSRAEAWLDLMQAAAFVPTKRLIGGVIVEIPRGSLVASVRWLSDRWKWSNTKVCLFLDTLTAEEMIRREKRQGNTVIFLCNYEKYNTGKRRESDGEATPGRHRDDNVEEGKEPQENVVLAHPAPPSASPRLKKGKVPLTIPEILDLLRPLYPHVNIDAEARKAQAHLLKPQCKGRQFTQTFFTNWLNRIDVPPPKKQKSPTVSPAGPEPVPDPPGWREFIEIHPEFADFHFAQLTADQQESFRDWAFRQSGEAFRNLRKTVTGGLTNASA